mmetsp:Transcript_14523/g.19910  ORF Transcript_14523/g.19910 Transcript_14523/m.19910 type:complete len:172 (+) Transcript_14523:52-567(+)
MTVTTEAKNPHVEFIKDKINSVIEKYPAVDDQLKNATKMLGGKVDKAFVAIGSLVIPLFVIFIFGVGHFLIDMVGFLYPMIESVKAIESDAKSDDTLWLTYWLIFALFKVTEGFADFLLSTIPFYFLLKGAFLVWCYAPSTKGADLIYKTVIRPYINPHLGLASDSDKKEQ